ncbi:MAG: hypothetical protein SCAL_000687 [Candidatus Syntrophoarchaeum caldarius]|uniref:Uncharacterized protein n=1 Tax=Candidatus Syntropharchaeum caldarium TaxID=1838285 RepID=A0A1F2P9P6_9EURY|nr:MAG: hypothetical protein SCAL_000687 [Candidatus Syntrophoarchaeum caldarius]
MKWLKVCRTFPWGESMIRPEAMMHQQRKMGFKDGLLLVFGGVNSGIHGEGKF